MLENPSRRSFFKLLGGAVALAATPIKALADYTEVNAKFGWCWSLEKNSGFAPGFAEMVKRTLAENAPLIRDNIGKHNSLLLKLKDKQKIKVNITYIDPQQQLDEMAAKVVRRLPDKKAQMQAEWERRQEDHKKAHTDAHKLGGLKREGIPGYDSGAYIKGTNPRLDEEYGI